MTGDHVSSLYVRQRSQSLEEFQVLVLKDWMFLTTLSWKKHVWANVSFSGSSLSQYLVCCSFGIYDTYYQQFESKGSHGECNTQNLSTFVLQPTAQVAAAYHKLKQQLFVFQFGCKSGCDRFVFLPNTTGYSKNTHSPPTLTVLV